MKAGRASQTAELVCASRAIAHALKLTPKFQDPTALALLPAEAQQRVADFLAKKPPSGMREAFAHQHLERLVPLITARTVAIDEWIREAPVSQVVILGAGLDGRAWRMPELASSIVFEVDHPDSQRDKRSRVTELVQCAREIRFVPVDFVRDSLDTALAGAGHDAALPTAWIWEGVVMYLTPAAIEATLGVIEQRSAPASQLCILYHSPAPILWLVGLFLRRIGEPLRSSFTARQMQELLAKYGFRVLRDEDAPVMGARLSPQIGKATEQMHHTRLVTAERP